MEDKKIKAKGIDTSFSTEEKFNFSNRYNILYRNFPFDISFRFIIK